MKNDYTLELIVGPMFAGKTEELIRKVRRASYAKKKVVIFKPEFDTRYAQDHVVTHNKDSIKAQNATTVEEIKNYCLENPGFDTIAVDEVQFLKGDVVNVLKELADMGYHVICSGLNTDFRDEPFGFMSELIAISDKVSFISAICVVCGDDATKTQRLIDGKPANYEDPIILLGASESYEARCRKHHVCKKIGSK